jgi:hypothetical protein
LAELQHAFALALLDDPARLPPALFAPGAVPPGAALAMHRDTAIGGLVQALAATFPTVKTLVGEACFDQIAAAFARARPPSTARLSGYGEGFPAFLGAWPAMEALPWIEDVARLDLAIERVAAARPGRRAYAIEAGLLIALPASLTVLSLDAPADLIRDAIDAGDEEALGAIDMTLAPRWLALWRTHAVTCARPLSPPAGLFLQGLLDGRRAQRALEAAQGAAGPAAALEAIQAEVFCAPFARITRPSPEGASP